MAQASDTKSTKSRFLSKSKWGKVFKENDTSRASENSRGSSDFGLNEDVSDFLRPSREASAEKIASVRPLTAPKLNIAIAQKWPGTQGVRLASAASPGTPQTRPIYAKPPRRPGLSVTFARTEPEVIGQGGDEAIEPVSEISRRKVLVSRSTSEKRTVPNSGIIGDPQADLAHDFTPKPLRRAQTSFNEYSPAVERKHATPTLEPATAEMPFVDRTAAGPSARSPGFDPYSQSTYGRLNENNIRNVPTIQNSTHDTDPNTPSSASQKYHDMRISEGMAFRRASTMIFDDDDELDLGGLGQPSRAPLGDLRNVTNETVDHVGRTEGLPTQFGAPTTQRNFGSNGSATMQNQYWNQPPGVQPIPQPQTSGYGAQRALGLPEARPAMQDRVPQTRLSPQVHPGSSETSRFRAPSSSSIDHFPAPTRFETERPSPEGKIITQSGHPSFVATSPAVGLPKAGQSPNEPALIDFSGRVEHMRGVFKLTADKERPAEHCDPQAWLRAGLWWYLNGKLGLEDQLLRRNPHGDTRELLTQAHVDLAKALWILQGPLTQVPDPSIAQETGILKSALTMLCIHMLKENIMPPHQSLIQGQDIRIWLQYPQFHPFVHSALSSVPYNATSASPPQPVGSALEILPVGDSPETFCFGRFSVEASMNTEESNSDRVPLPCICSMTRSRRSYQIGVIIASQNRDINLRIGARTHTAGSLSWSHISWKASSSVLIIHLQQGYDIVVKMQEPDFRRLWGLVEQSRSVERSLAPRPGEALVHDAPLLELQYADPNPSNPFPHEKLSNCRASVYEQLIIEGSRKRHDCYRIVLFTESNHKTISSTDHEICRTAPLYFEFLTDAAAKGTTAMVIRIRDSGKSCRALLVFRDAQSRQAFYDAINGLSVASHEGIVGRTQLKALSIAPSLNKPTSSSLRTALDGLEWQRLGVTNSLSNDADRALADTVGSDRLRLIFRHRAGCLTDWMNLDKGELLIRLSCGNDTDIQILREPQPDFTMSIDTRNTPQQTMDEMWNLLQLVRAEKTIRTLTFATSADLHAFQTSITGYNVCFEGVAATFGISRRMMVVPIYHKWQASLVRLQIVAKNGITKVLAFMDGFSRTDAMCIQVKSTDVFETGKGDNKGKKWTVKLVDAKFSLPRTEKSEAASEENQEDADRRLFINLDGLEYAEEHDDITIGFDLQDVRDAFADALPASTSVGRSLTLRRRI